MLLEKNADHADLASRNRKKICPSGRTLGDADRSDFLPPSTKIRTVRYNSLSCVLPLGEEAAAGRREGKSLSPSMVYAQPEEGGIAPPKWGAFSKLTPTGTTSFHAPAVNPQPFSRRCSPS